SRNFANKLWNATRFVMMNLDEKVVKEDLSLDDLEEEDKWILSRMNTVIKEVTDNLNKYEIGIAARKIYDFIWEEYCDWYIEIVKPRLYDERSKTNEVAQKVLLLVLKNILKLLHPFMPFITEEIWNHLPHIEEKLIVSDWPVYDERYSFEEAERRLKYIMEAIKGIRNARAEMNVKPSKKYNVIFVTEDESIVEILDYGKRYFMTLDYADEIDIRNVVEEEEIDIKKNNKCLDEDNVVSVVEEAEIYLPLEDLIDFEKEIERLEKEKEKLESELKRVEGKVSNKNFVNKAPKNIVDKEKAKKLKYNNMMEKVLERLKDMKKNI